MGESRVPVRIVNRRVCSASWTGVSSTTFLHPCDAKKSATQATLNRYYLQRATICSVLFFKSENLFGHGSKLGYETHHKIGHREHWQVHFGWSKMKNSSWTTIAIYNIYNACIYIYKYVSVTQTTLVLIGKDLVLDGPTPKIKDKQVFSSSSPLHHRRFCPGNRACHSHPDTKSSPSKTYWHKATRASANSMADGRWFFSQNLADHQTKVHFTIVWRHR